MIIYMFPYVNLQEDLQRMKCLKLGCFSKAIKEVTMIGLEPMVFLRMIM